MVKCTQAMRHVLKEHFYRFSCRALYIIQKILFGLSIKGKENVPQDRNYIIISRHRSYWDVPLIAASMGAENRIYFVARKTLVTETPLIGLLIKWLAITIDRDNFRGSDFKKILRSLKNGKILGIFPEGSTIVNETIHRGVIRFAEMTETELLPISIANEGPYPPDYPFHYPKMTVKIGNPFRIKELRSHLPSKLDEEGKYNLLAKMMMDKVDNPFGAEKGK